jgi:UPF0271 protein
MMIDLNADLAEGHGAWRIGDDDAMLDLVSSANIACGFHAGDPKIMDRTVRQAMARGVEIGAHVGFPDLQGFGRRVMQIEPAELDAMVIYQLGALAGIARTAGHTMTHMSLHGALGNMAASDTDMADHLMRAVASFDPNLIVISSTSRAIEAAAARHGLRLVTTFLADRAYDDDGLLVPRRVAGSVIHDPQAVLERVRRMLADGVVIAHSGKHLRTRPASILLHSDTQGALALAGAIRREIEAGGGSIVPVARQAASCQWRGSSNCSAVGDEA